MPCRHSGAANERRPWLGAPLAARLEHHQTGLPAVQTALLLLYFQSDTRDSIAALSLWSAALRAFNVTAPGLMCFPSSGQREELS